MTDPEHPLGAPHRADATAYLIGQRLKSEIVVGHSQGAGDPVIGSVGLLGSQKNINGLLKPAL